ncbi:multicopper oxidase-domain-containing protein [Thamnidium elegans]|nr:multicopper oxidase-domain-containing protein [Thamnidium elegans]
MYLKKVGFLLGSIILVTNAELHKYEFNITSGVINPDCSDKGVQVPHINGQFPGPTIHVQTGDEVEILVRNQMDHFNTSLHYHGIRQIGSTEADGVPGVTQHPITPGNSYTQRFTVSQQAGTYFYHAHVGLQDDSVQGSFIVYESDTANPQKVATGELLQAGPYQYKKDLLLQLSEWWHEDLDSRQAYYTSNSFTFDHGSDSILINGRTVHNPTAAGNSDKSCQGYTTFDVEPNTTYRLRVIGANSFRTLALAVKQHNLTMIEVDGELIHPYQTSFLEITPGQRFSVLLKTGDHPVGSTFAIGTSYLWRQRGRGVTENGFGYIRYVNPTAATSEKEKYYVDLPLFPKMDEPDWLWHNLKPLADRDPILDETDVRTIHLHTSTMKMPDNTTRYLINHRHISMQSNANLVENFASFQNQTYSAASDQYNEALGTYRLSHNEVVDLVFQNTKNAIGGCLLHPWHTHGHSHYVIASGAGSYEHEVDKDIRNFENPLYKDTTVVYPSIPTEDTDGCGWTKVRLLADNPGFWAVHCHITTHMLQGKMIILEEEPELMSKYSLYPRRLLQ